MKGLGYCVKLQDNSEIRINAAAWADDLILYTEIHEGMKTLLFLLSEFCAHAKTRVNAEKSVSISQVWPHMSKGKLQFQRQFDTSSPTTFSSGRKAFENSALTHAESFAKPCVRDGDVNAWPRTLVEAIDGVPAHFIRNRDEICHEECGDAALFTITGDLHFSYLTTVPRTSVQRSQKWQMQIT
jgi:hypothetical protein